MIEQKSAKSIDYRKSIARLQRQYSKLIAKIDRELVRVAALRVSHDRLTALVADLQKLTKYRPGGNRADPGKVVADVEELHDHGRLRRGGLRGGSLRSGGPGPDGQQHRRPTELEVTMIATATRLGPTMDTDDPLCPAHLIELSEAWADRMLEQIRDGGPVDDIARFARWAATYALEANGWHEGSWWSDPTR